VPQNSRNNSMGQGQLMLENYEKNYKYILYLLDLKIWGLKTCNFDLHYFVCDFVSVLPQITYVYGNMALIGLSYFHEFKKRNICRLLG
jgi:hypothetical protein